VNNLKKYFLTVLAAALVLSNFSYATTYMLCGMKDDNSSCCCKHKGHQPAKGLSLIKADSDCCKEGISELANNNLLSTVKIELPSDISSFPPVSINLENESLHSNNISFSYITQIEHVPKSDIPIFTSSLLI
jgi:hypothetical protein